MAVELFLAGNGPGELTGWIAPVARAARALAQAQNLPLSLTLALTPSQFASGREGEVVRRWALFDQVLEPGEVGRIAVGARHVAHGSRASLIHLGGDLWLSALLSRRLKVPATAIAEASLVARRHVPFSRIFAVSARVADELRLRGVPADKVLVTGDPRADAVEDIAREAAERLPHGSDRFLVSLLPGSRDRIFTVLTPYLLAVARALRDREPAVQFQVIVSEFVSRDLVTQVQAGAAYAWPDLPVTWITTRPWSAAASSDAVLTLPGTNTLELAMLGVPFAVVVDTDLLDRAPLEGSLEWLTRLPLVGRPLRRVVTARVLARQRFAALPNQRAETLVVPEWIGRWTPAELAKRVAELLYDAHGRREMGQRLRRLFGGPGGASRIIAQTALTLAGVEGL